MWTFERSGRAAAVGLEVAGGGELNELTGVGLDVTGAPAWQAVRRRAASASIRFWQGDEPADERPH